MKYSIIYIGLLLLILNSCSYDERSGINSLPLQAMFCVGGHLVEAKTGIKEIQKRDEQSDLKFEDEEENDGHLHKQWHLLLVISVLLLFFAVGVIYFFLKKCGYNRKLQCKQMIFFQSQMINQELEHRIKKLNKELLYNEKLIQNAKTIEEQRNELSERNKELRQLIAESKRIQKDKEELNCDLVNRNRSLKKLLDNQMALVNILNLEEAQAIGLELLYLLKSGKKKNMNDSQWDCLFDTINVLYGDLSALHKSLLLTEQESKVFYLTYIGLSNTEQAEHLVLKYDSVKKYKTRIKCKMNLGKEVSLEYFMRNYTLR